MYKDKDKQKAAVLRAVQKSRKGITQGITVQGITVQGITPEHPIMKYLIPGKKRDNMVLIVESLKRHKVLGQCFFGIGKQGLSLPFIEELLETTE